jgi:hypothetical protein
MGDCIKWGEDGEGEAGCSIGLIGRVRKTGAHLYLLIFKKELEGRAERGDHEDSGQEAPSHSTLHPQINRGKHIEEWKITG